ncbi:2Fe-2S iron-sulfur cluster binding domain-containing protein [Andreprevotia lacus DSM 23236]|jgi:NADPH-dependent 2,4-dienoyl-CoA reductase/sulfur reductase-like enzyme/ferredoxin|uniref:2Fe-2S iron-sulfur cluster binding domain-containing protein n=1 Tax=Andreprevotia lacus DSM 23236 TaxID=1121001 RepID=A0A1W1XN63_9NEIS|nr:FAD-dependent oxidoreductase [Andreprevotia lacus]SMC25312.1 2Fe-2S iron-sulfur cluster binding domain-containing protein [Andreprevotia lacus DSM 23236]
MSSAIIHFPNYLQIQSRVPLWCWFALRVGSVACALGMAALLVLKPELGLPLWWSVIVPVLPAVFFIAPGLWRNVCPMAALNQTPRLFGFTMGRTHTRRIREYSYVVGIALFLLLVSSRKWLFDQSGVASAALILFGLGGAFLGGLIFKGKSGWCSSICPMLPVQRVYGQTPFIMLRNAHCQPCVGCTKNCYDFNPGVAYLADQYDEDPRYSGYRRLFVGLLPGFILAFFTIPNGQPAGEVYLHFALYAGLSLALFHTLDILLKLPRNGLTVLFGALAFNFYYWFAAASWASSVGKLAGTALSDAVPMTIRVLLALLTLAWLTRSVIREGWFREQTAQETVNLATRLGAGASAALREASAAAQAEVVVEPDQRRLPAAAGATLLELVERGGCAIESGCRMGVCGADPIAIKDGMGNLSPVGDDEKNTLARLGHADNTRMACCARILGGTVTIALKPDTAGAPIRSGKAPANPDIKQVVIIGNGIAGVTAADHVRRRHPDCEIHVVAAENHALYNRMAITRLIYGRSAMQGLYLLPENWYKERNIDVWLNTAAHSIDPAARTVALADGEVLNYDKLILATGSNSFVPPINGYGGDGCYVLRTADDAMSVRSYAQRSQARHAVVAGGGLLGLEAAYALHKMGLRVSVIERNAWLLHRQLDEKGGLTIQRYLNSLGLNIVLNAQLDGVVRDDAGQQHAAVKDEAAIPADIFVVAAGIAPNIALAKAAGLTVNRAVVVDDAMRSSDPHIYAAGDVAEWQGKAPGLWPVAVEQAEVAACNALGEARDYAEPVLSTMLKVVGADVVSIGRFAPQDGDEVFVEEDVAAHRYRKLLVAGGQFAGAILIGWPAFNEPLGKAVKGRAAISPAQLAGLRAGQWDVLL